MKDEEMAEQFADNISGLELTCSLLSAKDKSHAYRLGRYDGFLAGLKAGRPQWHDLEKDPNDLPKEEKQYVVKAKDFDGDITVWICWYWTETKTFTGSYLSEMNVIKWKEIE
jgi:hypothetical protein